MDAGVAGLLGALIGGAASLLGSWLGTWLNARSEERRAYRALAVQAATDQFAEANQTFRLVFEKSGKAVELPKFDHILIQKLELMRMLNGPCGINETNLTQCLERLAKLRSRMVEFSTASNDGQTQKQKSGD